MYRDVCEQHLPALIPQDVLFSSRSIPPNRPLPTLSPRALQRSDKDIICSWVQSRKALQRISGNIGDRLTPDILATWIEMAEESIVVVTDDLDAPAGFCTLSLLEAPHLPESHLEICHLIVDPCFRHLLVGSRLCTAAKIAASTAGYRFVCGRVVPENTYTLALARLHRFQEVTTPERWAEAGFRWFEFDLAQRHLFRDTSNNHEEERSLKWHQLQVNFV